MRRPSLALLAALAGGGTVLLGLGAALAAPLVFHDRLVALVLDAVSTRADADVALGRADATLLAAFPDLTLSVEDLAVTGRGAYAGVPLAKVGRLEVTVDLASLVGGGPVRVTGLSIADGTLDLRVDADGRTNFSPGAPAADAAPTAPSALPELWLEDLSVAGLSLRFADAAADRWIEARDIGLNADAEVGGERLSARGEGAVGALTVREGGVTLLSEARVVSTVDARYAPATGALDLGDGMRLRVNALDLGVAGTIVPGDTGTDLDLRFAAAPTTFGGLLSLVPGAWTPDFAGVAAEGALAARGAVKGRLLHDGDTLPAFEIAVQVTDGRFRYPSLPAAVSDIQLDLAATNPGGSPDATTVEVRRFRMAVDGSPVEGRLSLRTPVSDPDLDMTVKGRVNLGKLSAALPPEVSGWTGVMDVDAAVAGRASAFLAHRVDEVRAGGTFTLADATWRSPTQPVPITVEELRLVIDPRTLDLASFRVRFPGSDLSASGSIENAIGWALADGVLVGAFDARASVLDLEPWARGGEGGAAGGPAPADAPADDSSLFAVPPDVDLALGVAFGEVRYNGWELRGVRGGTRIKDGRVRLDGLRLATLGGEVGVSGTYAADTDRAADIDLRVDAAGISAGEAVAKIETLRSALSGLRDIGGRVRADFGVQARIGKDLSPDLPSLRSAGTLAGTGLVVGADFLAPIATFLGDPRLGRLAVDGVSTRFQIENGKLQLSRMGVSLGAVRGGLGGAVGVLDGALDLRMDLAAPSTAVPGSAAIAALGGRAAPATLDIRADIGGTWKEPKVKVGLGEVLGAAVGAAVGEVREAVEQQVAAVVDDALDEVRAQGDALVAEAEKQATRLRAEAAKQAARLRSEADGQAKKLVRDAKGNPLREAAAKEAARVVRAEADKAADRVEREADRQADAAVQAARKEKDRLVAGAAARAGR